MWTAHTFKVYRAIPVVICFFDYGVYLSPAHVLSHQLGHGRPQLLRCDLSIPIHVELTRGTREEEQREHTVLLITAASESGEEGGFLGSLESLRKVLESDLFKGVFELLHANHPSCFCQKLWGHQVYKVLKVNSATNWEGNRK